MVNNNDLLEKHSQLLMSTNDPKHEFMGQPVPALTSLLYNVCERDQTKFDEAMRIILLFIEKATEKTDV